MVESAERDRSGAASEHAGLISLAMGFIMEGLASALGKLERLSRGGAEKKSDVPA